MWAQQLYLKGKQTICAIIDFDAKAAMAYPKKAAGATATAFRASQIA